MIDSREDFKAMVSKIEAVILREKLLAEKLKDCEIALNSAESERDELKAKLADLEKHEPAHWQYQDRSGKWCDFLHDDHRRQTIDSMAWPIRKLYTQPKPSAPAQRIAEQDVLAIINSWLGYEGLNWFNDEGRTLLAKLNEHREPAQSGEPVDFLQLRTVQKLVEDAFNSGYEQGKNPKAGLIGALRETYVSAVDQILSSQVAPNKAEVPISPILKFLEVAQNIIDEYPYLYPEIARTRSTDWMAHILQRPNGNPIITGQGMTPEEACQSALDSLPPLKGDDK